LTDQERHHEDFEYLPPSPEAYGDIRLVASRANNYFMNWEIHKTRKFGIPTVHMEDVAVAESQGVICDRTLENLTQADEPIIAVRERLLSAALALAEQGTPPAGLFDAAIYQGVHGCQLPLPKETDWIRAMQDERLNSPVWKS
jgi:hypothetical protein